MYQRGFVLGVSPFKAISDTMFLVLFKPLLEDAAVIASVPFDRFADFTST
jgi:hypothetical protein